MLGQHTTAERSEGAVGEDESVPDDDHALGERLDVVHVVRGEDHRHAALAVERLHEVAHGELGDGIEADRPLVEEKHARLVHHAGGDLAADAVS